jgi:hypothetical protein
MTVNLNLADWDCPEFAALPPDRDLIEEWEQHDRKRNAPRHPDQPRYETQYTAFVDERLNDVHN